MFLLGETLALDELQFNTGEQRQLNEHLLVSSESDVPYIVKLAAYLTKTVPVISSSLELLFDRYRIIPFTTKRVNVEPIWQRSISITSPPTTHSNGHTSHSETTESHSLSMDSPASGESLVDTTLSYLQMLLLCFILLYSFGCNDPSYHNTTIILKYTLYFQYLSLTLIFIKIYF